MTRSGRPKPISLAFPLHRPLSSRKTPWRSHFFGQGLFGCGPHRSEARSLTAHDVVPLKCLATRYFECTTIGSTNSKSVAPPT